MTTPVGMTKGRIAFSLSSRAQPGDLQFVYWGKAKVNRSLPDAMATYCVPATA